MMECLLPVETYEVGNIYVGEQKILSVRLILYYLTEKHIRNMLRLKSLQTARKKIDGMVAMHTIKKG
ncbi:hypothetical protein BK767_12745 [Bacillus thuringiensis serovar kyushuensis]|nr:hypothetical protein BK767_12745 [Bacillus thuringiensis serovar kyushuensis]OTZ78854.1 hypothetical protein BK768_07865 [Bacillus thuringiensis serovar tohokuensis]OUB95616.1 hypothetical protein BK773_05860 [Bacillus thuringiensis serovar indiana]